MGLNNVTARCIVDSLNSVGNDSELIGVSDWSLLGQIVRRNSFLCAHFSLPNLANETGSSNVVLLHLGNVFISIEGDIALLGGYCNCSCMTP